MLIALLVTTYSTPPPYATTASVADRTRISVAVASYVHDPSGSNKFKSLDVEIGATAIDWPYALADWKSADGKRSGQVLFFHICDDWGVAAVSLTTPLTLDELTHSVGRMTKDTGSQLISKLNELEGQRIAFLKPATPVQGC